jgi:MOSC domain-containing protein YiiM
MLDDKQTMKDLMAILPQAGRLDWIGVRPARREPLQTVAYVEAVAGYGLQGDHRMQKRPGGKRQVTLIQSEHMPVINSLCQSDSVMPEILRRNLMVSGINLLALKDRCFAIGEVVLEFSGLCHPCSRMEEYLGPGGYNAMRGHGGINARIIRGGVIRVGDIVRVVEPL